MRWEYNLSDFVVCILAYLFHHLTIVATHRSNVLTQVSNCIPLLCDIVLMVLLFLISFVLVILKDLSLSLAELTTFLLLLLL